MAIITAEDKMRLVLALAEEGMEQGEIPIAAIIFHENEIISKAYTSEKKEARYLVHAEMQAINEMDIKRLPIRVRKEMQLFTNLEPCLMCYGAAIHSFVGEVYYSIESVTDGGVVWAEKTWQEYHEKSVFSLPKIYKGILANESKELFKRYLEINPFGGASDWVKTLI